MASKSEFWTEDSTALAAVRPTATCRQPTFAELEFQGKKRKTRRELFLGRMDGLIPWQRLEDRIRPMYPKAGKGRRAYPLAVMLRIHCVQLFYNLGDPGMEDPRFHGGGLCSMRLNRCAGSLV